MDVAIEDAFAETKESFESACAIYPDKQICFTELGWATRTAHDDHADYASVANQKRYLEEVADYLKSEEIVGFVFEAFDELWKDPSSPAASECNWGIYDINRKKNGKFAGIPLLRLKMVGLYNLVHHEPVVSVKAVSRVTDM